MNMQLEYLFYKFPNKSQQFLKNIMQTKFFKEINFLGDAHKIKQGKKEKLEFIKYHVKMMINNILDKLVEI